MTKKNVANVVDAILETAEDMHRTGLMNERTYRRIIVRYLGKAALENTKPMNGSKIRKMRLRAKLSQASFANRFNLSRSYISQWERGVSQPNGAALVLLNLIRRKGFDAIL